MEQLINILISGIVAASVMMVVMILMKQLHLTDLNLIETIGTLFKKDLDYAVISGLLTHLLLGVVFAIPYSYIFGLLPVTNPASVALTGAVLGFFHGYIVSFALVVSLAEYHPVQVVKENGFGAALAYVAGHVVYGGTLGLIWGVLQTA